MLLHHHHSHLNEHTFVLVHFVFLRAATPLSLIEVKVSNILSVSGSSRAALSWLLLQLSLPDLGQPRLKEGSTLLLKLLTFLTLSVSLRENRGPSLTKVHVQVLLQSLKHESKDLLMNRIGRRPGTFIQAHVHTQIIVPPCVAIYNF